LGPPSRPGVGSVDVAELVIERSRDVGEPVQLRLGGVAWCGGRDRVEGTVVVGERDLHHLPFLHPVGPHVDRFEDTGGTDRYWSEMPAGMPVTRSMTSRYFPRT